MSTGKRLWLLKCVLPALCVFGQAQQKALLLASGESQGNYTKLANAISRVAEQNGIKLQPVLSAGSVDNIKLLTSGHADLALVQGDVAVRAVLGHLPFSDPITNIELLTPIFTEPIHILVRDDLFIFSVDDLKGKAIAIGVDGSGGQITSRSVLEAAGVSLGEFQPRTLSIEQIVPQFAAESIDAAIITSAIPVDVVAQTLINRDARLLVLDPKLISRMTSSGSYVEAYIPGRTYAGQEDDVPTIGTQCLLLVRSDVDQANVVALMGLLQARRGEIERISGTKMDLLFRTVPAQLPIQTYPGAKRYLSKGFGISWLWLIPVLLLGYLCAILILKRKHVRQATTSVADLIVAISALFGVWVFAALGLYWCERHVNENFDTFPKSMWSVLVYVSGGFQARAPKTTWGERVAVFAIIVGVALVGWVIAEFGKRYISEELGKWMGRIRVPSHLAKHIVLINWDHRAERMIEQLRGPDTEKKSIVVIAHGPSVFPGRPGFERCYWISGDATDSKVLEQAQVKSASSIVILGNWQSDSVSQFEPDITDAKTVLALLVLRGFCDTPVTAEIRSTKNLEAAHTAGKGGPTECVCGESFGIDVLTQCAFTPGLAGLYHTLLTFSPDSDEIYRVKVPEQLVNRRFSDALHFYASRDSKARAVIPIAISRGIEVYLNPGDEFGPLKQDDHIFVICDNEEAFYLATKSNKSRMFEQSVRVRT